jgi:hypothetical protein
MSYSSSLEASIVLYQEGRYKEAYDLITREHSSPDAIPALVYYLRFSFACKAGMHELAIDLLREAVVGKGYWYSSDYLGDDDLEPLRGRREFKELAELCKLKQGNEEIDARSEVELIVPSGGTDKPPAVIIALHGNQLNIPTTRLNWCGEALSDCLVILPQSSHAVCTGAYSWVDPEIGSYEVASHLDEIKMKNTIDKDRLMVGGFSAGGRVALHMLLKGMVKAKGIILLGPWLPDLVSLEPLIPRLRDAMVRVYLICGDQDKDCYDSTNQLAGLLRDNGIFFKYRVVCGMGHCYPSDFEADLAEARSFILEE